MRRVLSLWKGELLVRRYEGETMREIARRVAAGAGLTLADLRSGNPSPRIARVRHQAWAEMADTGRFSWRQMAECLEANDRSTAAKAVKRLKRRLAA